jgi:hypothetical protein
MVSDAYIPCRKLFIDTINIFFNVTIYLPIEAIEQLSTEVNEHLGLTRSMQ